MNLYLISQDVVDDYDTYSDAVVAAENEDEARTTHPDSSKRLPRKNEHYLTWANDPAEVHVKLLGKAVAGTEAGVGCASFHSG